jgi:2-keto-4-pentenoate hydratase
MTTTGAAGVAGFADALWQAELERTAIPPITGTRPDLTVPDAYAIQNHNVARRVAAGGVARGHKLGLTSRAAQESLGVAEPTFGILLSDMFLDDGEEIPPQVLLAPRVEAEIAFALDRDLAGPGVTVADAVAAVGGVMAALEVADSRIVDWRVRIVDSVADNAAAARVVLGSRLLSTDALDLRLEGVLTYSNGIPVDSGAGAAAMGYPVRCVAWLANTLGSLGSGLRRGDIVLSGALHRMVPARPDDVFEAQFAHLGGVSVSFGSGRFGGSPP